MNAAFLTLAIREGLTMAIANPSQELLVSCALASDLLLAKEGADLRYIEYADTVSENRKKKEEALKKELLRTKGADSAAQGTEAKADEKGGGPATDESGGEASPHMAALKHAVLKGNRSGIGAITNDALAAGEDPQKILNEALLPAINEVGELFDKGKYFLPQLIGSAEAMKNAIEVLEPLLRKETDAQDMPVVIIATVEGDIHDIGKNLVALMLKNYGFQVIDLGKDVPKEEIVRAAREHNAQIIALSALMTTTMQRMREVIALAREENIAARVMIGGAVITQDYADEIGADGYSRDAAEAVRVAQRLTDTPGVQELQEPAEHT